MPEESAMQHTKQQLKMIEQATQELSGQWLGQNSDGLFYHRMDDVYEWADMSIKDKDKSREFVCGFQTYAAMLASNRMDPPMSFDWVLVKRKEPYSPLLPAVEKINVRKLEEKTGAQERVCFAPDAGDEKMFVFYRANFSESSLERDGESVRVIRAEPFKVNVRESAAYKADVYLFNAKSGLLPWDLKDLVNSIVLPEAITTDWLYDTNSAVSEVSVKNASSKNQSPVRVNSQTYDAFKTLSDTLQSFSINGDLIDLQFLVPVSVEPDQDDEGRHVGDTRIQDVNLKELSDELVNTVRVFVSEALKEHHVEGHDYHKPFSSIVKMDVTHDDDVKETLVGYQEKPIVDITYQDHVQIQLATNEHVVATKELIDALRDTFLEYGIDPENLTITCTNKTVVSALDNILTKYNNAIVEVGKGFAARELPRIFQENNLSWNAVTASASKSTIQDLTSDSEMSVKAIRVALADCVSIAIQYEGLMKIAQTLPSIGVSVGSPSIEDGLSRDVLKVTDKPKI